MFLGHMHVLFILFMLCLPKPGVKNKEHGTKSCGLLLPLTTFLYLFDKYQQNKLPALLTTNFV